DMSNPYNYPVNTQSSLDEVHTSKSDPELQKITSMFWMKAGELQSSIGQLTGLDSWRTSGELLSEEAERQYEEAQNKLEHHEASKLHGHYDRIVGLMEYATGHIAGDSELEEKGKERKAKGEQEINQS
ncbi:hypothetical protein BDB01DRAFT_706004, partial [Pilobolus umbonatus]